MRKSVKREYELDRSYDYSEAYGFKNTKRNVGFVKKRAHKRFRRQMIPIINNIKEDLNV
jgi:hypothetical protein